MPLFFSAWVTVLASKAWLVTEKVLMNSVPLYSTYQAKFQKNSTSFLDILLKDHKAHGATSFIPQFSE